MKKNIEKLHFNGSVFKRLISLTIMLTLIAPVLTKAQASKTNFTGDWTFNAQKSPLPQGVQGNGGGTRMGGGDFVATQEANILNVIRTRTGADGKSATITHKYTLDGKESVNTSPKGDSKSIAKWSADGKSLTIETSTIMNMNGESKTIKSTEVWTLNDAKTLTIALTNQSPNGEVKTLNIYNKK